MNRYPSDADRLARAIRESERLQAEGREMLEQGRRLANDLQAEMRSADATWLRAKARYQQSRARGPMSWIWLDRNILRGFLPTLWEAEAGDEQDVKH